MSKIDDIIAARVKARLAQINKSIDAVVDARLAEMLGPDLQTLPAVAATPAAPTRRNTVRQVSHPSYTLIGLNPNFVGQPCSHGTKVMKAWVAISQHLSGGKELPRYMLQKEIGMLLDEHPNRVSGYVSTLIERGALVTRIDFDKSPQLARYS